VERGADSAHAVSYHSSPDTGASRIAAPGASLFPPIRAGPGQAARRAQFRSILAALNFRRLTAKLFAQNEKRFSHDRPGLPET
jgi:hypothetical protein